MEYVGEYLDPELLQDNISISDDYDSITYEYDFEPLINNDIWEDLDYE